MNPANLETFLEALFTDNEDVGIPVPGRPGYVEYPQTVLTPEERQLRRYDDKEPWPTWLALDPDEHGAAYSASMLALLLMRRYWRARATLEEFEDNSPEEAVGSMAEDVLAAVSYLQIVHVALRQLSKGEDALRHETQLNEVKLQSARDAAAVATHIEKNAATGYKNSRRALGLFRALSEGPVEQLARVDQDSNALNTEKTGA